MKKICFIVLCIVMGTFTAFGYGREACDDGCFYGFRTDCGKREYRF